MCVLLLFLYKFKENFYALLKSLPNVLSPTFKPNFLEHINF